MSIKHTAYKIDVLNIITLGQGSLTYTRLNDAHLRKKYRFYFTVLHSPYYKIASHFHKRPVLYYGGSTISGIEKPLEFGRHISFKTASHFVIRLRHNVYVIFVRYAINTQNTLGIRWFPPCLIKEA